MKSGERNESWGFISDATVETTPLDLGDHSKPVSPVRREDRKQRNVRRSILVARSKKKSPTLIRFFALTERYKIKYII